LEIKERIDEYLEFDSSEIFNKLVDPTGAVLHDPLVRIFGGAIRDIIAGEPTIHDIDIISGAQSIRYLGETLTKHGYIFMESLIPKDLSSIYSDIKIINEPHTWVKGTKIVQIIRPVINIKDILKNDQRAMEIYKEGFKDLIYNVDISCCGLSWDGKTLYENYPEAITHCLTKSFSINSNAKMYSEKRTPLRRHKLEERGWGNITPRKYELGLKRELRIESLINSDLSINSVKEYDNLNFVMIHGKKRYKSVIN